MNNRVFVKTENVRQFSGVARDLTEATAGVPGMGLVYGKRGLGKTRTALWYAARTNAVYLRAKRKWTPTWLAEELSVELMLAPARTFRAMFQEVTAALTADPRLILIDETDLICPDVLETIRDIHDITGTPVMLIGMDSVRRRLERFAALFDRFLHVLEFRNLTDDDIRLAAQDLLSVKLADDVIRHVRGLTDGNFRKSIVVMKGFEKLALTNGVKQVTMTEVGQWTK